MGSIISSVLLLARQEQEAASTEPVSLEEGVPRCWQSVATGQADVVVEDDLTFAADTDRIRSVFENLFRNVVEHGGDDVAVRVGVIDDGDGFYVADDGDGIPSGTREQVFETGFSTGSEGLGLGMTIVEGASPRTTGGSTWLNHGMPVPGSRFEG